MRRTLPLLVLLAGCSELSPVSTVDDGSNAYEAYADAHGNRMEAFHYGGDASNDVVDFVFVLDNSISMRKVLNRVRKGLSGLDASAFPAETRIAFLSTLPANLDKPDRLHKTVWNKKIARHDPGFGKFVSAESLRRSVQMAPETAKSFPHTGCSEWFHPREKNAQGVPCMIAHSQISTLGVEAEAGLTAFDQLLSRNAGAPTFRPGASVNVVFISDTHDPGLPTNTAGELLEERPTAEEIVQHILVDNAVSSVRFHAIAPQTECVEQWVHLGPSYFQAAEETGGVQLDVCTAKDYRELLKSAFDIGAAPVRPTFGLAHPPTAIEEVFVDGEPTNYEQHPSLPAITVDLPTIPKGSTTSPAHNVEIHYQAPLAPVATPSGR